MSRESVSAAALLKAFPRASVSDVQELVPALGFAAGDPMKVDEVLEAANSVLGGHGVEGVPEGGPGGYYMDIGLLYVNTGETYDATLCYDTSSSKFFVGSWGDWVEELEAEDDDGEEDRPDAEEEEDDERDSDTSE